MRVLAVGLDADFGAASPGFSDPLYNNKVCWRRAARRCFVRRAIPRSRFLPSARL